MAKVLFRKEILDALAATALRQGANGMSDRGVEAVGAEHVYINLPEDVEDMLLSCQFDGEDLTDTLKRLCEAWG